MINNDERDNTGRNDLRSLLERAIYSGLINAVEDSNEIIRKFAEKN